MIPTLPQTLLALLLIPLTLAFPLDTSPNSNRNLNPLTTGPATCKTSFPQFYTINKDKKDIFQEAASFRANSQRVCNDILPNLYKPKQKEHTLYFTIHDADIFVNMHDLLWDKTLVVVYKLSLTDKGAEAVHAGKGKKGAVSQDVFNKFCVASLEEYGSKGEKGCTKDPGEFSNSVNSVGRRTTTTGILGGSVQWMHAGEHFATLEVSFQKPESQVS
ncbi:hypothetical protein BJX99DRAFT_263294 [Aspergillus californicus]